MSYEMCAILNHDVRGEGGPDEAGIASSLPPAERLAGG